MDEKNKADAEEQERRNPKPFFPPEGLQRCAQPNFEYLDVKARSARNYRFPYLYDEYKGACEAAGYRAIRFSTFNTDFSLWRIEHGREEIPDWFPAELMQTYWTRLEIGGGSDESGGAEASKAKGRRAKAARTVPLFAAYLPYSGMAFLRATEDIAFTTWMRCCAQAYRAFGGVPYATEFDRANDGGSGATAEIRRATLQAFAAHYRTVLFHPRPKARGEMKEQYGSLVLKRFTPATTFVRDNIDIAPDAPLAEVNRQIDRLVAKYNAKGEGTNPPRRRIFEKREANLLLELPEADYDMALWAERRVGAGYHFNHDRVRYSVPYQYAGEPVRVRIGDGFVEAYSMGKLIARHDIPKDSKGKGVVTNPDHRPPEHRAFANRLEDRFMALALEHGPATGAIMREIVLQCKAREGESWRPCKDLLDLSRTPSAITLEEACAKALERNLPLTAESAEAVMREETR